MWRETAIVSGILLALLVVGSLFQPARAAAPAVGDTAPPIRLKDQDGEWRSLEDFRGRWVALYFYPKADTPGCTTEACEFRDNNFAFEELNATILGVSIDKVEDQKKFAEKYTLPFPLLADTEGEAAKSYGVMRSIGPLKLAKRQSFLIDPEGRIVKHYEEVDPKTHSAEVLADLKAESKRSSGL